MKYKDPQNKVHHLDSVEFEYILPFGCVQISEAEAELLTAQDPILPPTKADRETAIDSAIKGSEPLRLILEAIEDAQGTPRGVLIAEAKNKVT